MRLEARRALIATIALCATVCAPRAHAHPVGTVFSGPVDGDTASVFWNPAAMALATESRFDFVLNGQVLQGTIQRAGIDSGQTGRAFPSVSLVSLRPEPELGLIIDKLWHKRLRIGFAISVPEVAGASWPRTLSENGQTILGPTRYHVTNAQVFHLFAQLGASIVLHPTFSIGATVNVVFSHLDVDKDVDLANQAFIRGTLPCAQNPLGCENPALSAPINLNGNGVSAGASIGVLWMPIPQVRIGAAYVSPVKVPIALNVSIDATKLSSFAQRFLPSFSTLAENGSGSATVTVPQRAHLGISGMVHPRVELMGMVVWINYSATEIVGGTITTRSSTLVPDSLRIPNVRNDSWTAIVRVVGRIKERTKLGCSLEFMHKTVPDEYMSPSNLDFDNLSLNFGAKVRVWGRVYLGGSFTQVIVIPRTISGSAYSNESAVPYNLPDASGVYSGNAERIGLDLTALF